MKNLTIVLGTAGFDPNHNYQTPADAKTLLDAVKSNGVRHLDTAQLYGASESFLGELKASEEFNIDTKSKGGFDSSHQALIPENLYKDAKASLDRLQQKQVDVFYIHAPDDTHAPSEWLPTIDKLHKEGVFKRLGLSNFRPEQVREVYDESKAKGFVLPSVFQGNYSAVTRAIESDLFPVLRELKISFYAYSPMAGGFLAKTKQSLEQDSVQQGRFAAGGKGAAAMYRSMYLKPSLLDALEEWGTAAKEQGVSQAELAYRWIAHHSVLSVEHGDAIIIGARTVDQAVETIQGIQKGPLDDKIVRLIDDVWEKVKHEAPLDNYHSFAKAA